MTFPRPGRSPWLVIGGAALALLVVAGGVTVAVSLAGSGGPVASFAVGATGSTGASSSPSPDTTPSASPTPTPSATPNGPMYHVDTDVCDRIPVGALGNWVARPPHHVSPAARSGTGVPNSYMVKCELTADSNRPYASCKLTVSVQIYDTAGAARAAYSAELTRTPEADQSLKGYGELAFGRYFTDDTTDPQFKVSGYDIVMQKENLLLDVDVALWAYEGGFVAKQAAQSRVGTETKAILPLVPRS